MKKIKLKALNRKDYKLDLSQSRVKIMDHATAVGNYEHKFISALDRHGLTAVKFLIQNIFLITGEKFRFVTQQNTHLTEVNINELTDNLLENTELISYFNSILDTSGVGTFDNNGLEKLLHDMLSLYLRLQSHSLVRDIVSKHKFSLKNNVQRLSKKELKSQLKNLK